MPVSDAGTTGELVARIQAGFRPVRDAAQALSPAALESASPAGWTLKEMLAHVAYWEETVVPRLAALRAGGAEGSGRSVDEVNAEVAREARARSGREVLERWDAAHAALLEAVRALSAAELSDRRFIDTVVGETYEHYPEHAAELKGARPGDLEDERGLDGW